MTAIRKVAAIELLPQLKNSTNCAADVALLKHINRQDNDSVPSTEKLHFVKVDYILGMKSKRHARHLNFLRLSVVQTTTMCMIDYQ